MLKKLFALLYVLALSLGTIACQKLEARPSFEATFAVEKLRFTDAIPLDYGELLAVTPTRPPHQAALWFQSPDRTITVVRVNVSVGGFAVGDALIIPRR